MNRVRRKEIEGLIASLEAIVVQIETQTEIAASIRNDEEEYRDAMHENLQGSARYQAADAAIDAIFSAEADLQSFDFDSVIEQLREAMA